MDGGECEAPEKKLFVADEMSSSTPDSSQIVKAKTVSPTKEKSPQQQQKLKSKVKLSPKKKNDGPISLDQILQVLLAILTFLLLFVYSSAELLL